VYKSCTALVKAPASWCLQSQPPSDGRDTPVSGRKEEVKVRSRVVQRDVEKGVFPWPWRTFGRVGVVESLPEAKGKSGTLARTPRHSTPHLKLTPHHLQHKHERYLQRQTDHQPQIAAR
jgi:hypothetical protein